jgi:hypothetical protein
MSGQSRNSCSRKIMARHVPYRFLRDFNCDTYGAQKFIYRKGTEKKKTLKLKMETHKEDILKRLSIFHFFEKLSNIIISTLHYNILHKMI